MMITEIPRGCCGSPTHDLRWLGCPSSSPVLLALTHAATFIPNAGVDLQHKSLPAHLQPLTSITTTERPPLIACRNAERRRDSTSSCLKAAVLSLRRNDAVSPQIRNRDR